ncbi:MAG: ThuA domain-containing protein [Saprospiraceae bacterium]|nr:ThuA domain-containing protein [Saprospiraceae bacterium]
MKRPSITLINRYLFSLIVLILMILKMPAQDSLHLMIVTGGHDFDRFSFFEMFESMEHVTFEEVIQPKANQMIGDDGVQAFDALVFYDMYDSITTDQKNGYLRLIAAKKPLIFLHHSLVSYQDWPTFKNIIGGKYHTLDTSRASHYKHDEHIQVQVVQPTHPITKGIADFEVLDETYGDCEINKDVVPLLTTSHPLSMLYLGWINHFSGHKILYLQGGHGPSAYADPNFRKILGQAIRWSIDDK